MEKCKMYIGETGGLRLRKNLHNPQSGNREEIFQCPVRPGGRGQGGEDPEPLYPSGPV